MFEAISQILNALAIVAGAWSAYLWHKASEVPVHPTGGFAESGDAETRLNQGIFSLTQAYSRSAALNKRAAFATFVAVLLQMGPPVIRVGIASIRGLGLAP